MKTTKQERDEMRAKVQLISIDTNSTRGSCSARVTVTIEALTSNGIDANNDREALDVIRTALAEYETKEDEPSCDCGGMRDGDRHESWCAGAVAENAMLLRVTK